MTEIDWASLVIDWKRTTPTSWMGQYEGYVLTVEESDGGFDWRVMLPMTPDNVPVTGSADRADLARAIAKSRFAEIAKVDMDLLRWRQTATTFWVGEYMAFIVTVQESESTWVWTVNLPVVTTGLTGSVGSLERAKSAATHRALDFHVPYHRRPS